MKNERELVRK